MTQARLVHFGLMAVAMLAVVIIQVSFVTLLPLPWRWVQLPLVAMWFVVLIIDYPLGLWATAVGGALWELYSPLPWGGLVLPLILIMVLANMLFKAIFTNRSLFSLIVLATGGTLIWYGINGFWNLILFWLGQTTLAAPLDWPWLQEHTGRTVATVLVLAGVFILMRLFTKRGQSVFLIGGRR